MTKLLITGGCSFTDSKYPSYKEHNVEVWPNIIEKNSDRLLVNVASYGASNDLIENKIFDAVTKYSEYDCLVMVLWTNAYRVNVADDWRHRTINIEDRDLKFSKKVFEKFFRNMKRTKFLCDHYGFQWQFRSHGHGHHQFHTNYLEEWLKNHPIQEEVNMAWDEIIYGCTTSFHSPFYLPCWHPNQMGHERIANMFTTGVCDPIVRTQTQRVGFVYD
jgi:hypothetical protein